MKKAVLLFVFVVFVCVVGFTQENDLLENKESLYTNVRVFADALTIISSEYVKPVEIQDLLHGAIKGMMETLDGYSQFLDAKDFKKMTDETRGEFGGIGIRIGIQDGLITVIAPLEGTPAYEKGVQSGDRIVKIEDEITRDMTLNDAVERMRGEPGTELNIIIAREDGEELIELTIERAVIQVESIRRSEMIEGNIGYIRLTEFQRRTAEDVRQTISDLKDKGAKNLILDLRNNPGGLLTSAVETTDLFLPKDKLIVYTEGSNDKKSSEFSSQKDPVIEEMKLIVLVNKGSASASEILAGAVQDNKIGMVLGEPTFWKGSVQTVVPLRDGTALRITTAAYFTPLGNNLMDKGIEPDIFVEQLPLEQKREKKLEADMRREELFRKLLPDRPEVQDPSEEREIEFWENDQQLLTAVRLLKGIELFAAGGVFE